MMKVAVVTALYFGDRYLPELFGSLEKIDYPRDSVRIIMIDNNPTDAAKKWIEKHVMPKAGKNLPAFELIVTGENTGFAGGNNRCIARAMELGCDAVYLLNEDATGNPDFLKRAVENMEAHPEVGAVQSFILLNPGDQGVNSIGHGVHYLGFAYCSGYRMSKADALGFLRVRHLSDPLLKISAASGAGVLYRAETLRKIGVLDESYFLYHEDVDLAFRVREAGYAVVIEPKSVVHHRYEFKKSISKFYWMERNRYRFMLEHYKWPTLVVLFPGFILSELGLIVFSIFGGSIRERFRAYGYFFSWGNLKTVMEKRRSVQSKRVVGDCELLKDAVTSIEFQDVKYPVMRFINPLMAAYWWVAKKIIVW